MSGSSVSKTTKSILLTVSVALFLGALGARLWATLKAAEVVVRITSPPGPRHVYLHMLKVREPSTIYALVFVAGFGVYLYFSGLWRILLA